MFRKLPVILKIVPKAGHECTLEKINHESKGKPEQKFDAGFRNFFRISTVIVFKQTETSH
jgi:hypothetical protein